MKKKILILGGSGKMGHIVWNRLKNKYDVTVGDICKTNPDMKYIKFNIQSNIDQSTVPLFKSYDIIVNCLPSAVSSRATKLAAFAGTHCVDLSFSLNDPFAIHELAKKNNCCVIPDTGVSPGLTNLWAGRISKEVIPDSVYIYVGGVSKSPFEPYGHANTWNVEDLLEEYLRRCRFIQAGLKCVAQPLNSLKLVDINGITMESFLSDSLRTLLKTDLGFIDIQERTLRWPGHIKAIEPLIFNGTFVETIKKECQTQEDTVIFKIDAMSNGVKEFSVLMIDHYKDGITAMARTTGFTCASVVDMLASGVYNKVGVNTMEKIGQNDEAFSFIIDSLPFKFKIERND